MDDVKTIRDRWEKSDPASIGNALADIPALLAEIDRMKKELESWKRVVEDICTGGIHKTSRDRSDGSV